MTFINQGARIISGFCMECTHQFYIILSKKHDKLAKIAVTTNMILNVHIITSSSILDSTFIETSRDHTLCKHMIRMNPPMYQLQLRTCCSFFTSSHTTCDSEVRHIFVIHFLNSVVKIVWYLVISSLFTKPTLHITVYSRKHRLLVMST